MRKLIEMRVSHSEWDFMGIFLISQVFLKKFSDKREEQFWIFFVFDQHKKKIGKIDSILRQYPIDAANNPLSNT